MSQISLDLIFLFTMYPIRIFLEVQSMLVFLYLSEIMVILLKMIIDNVTDSTFILSKGFQCHISIFHKPWEDAQLVLIRETKGKKGKKVKGKKRIAFVYKDVVPSTDGQIPNLILYLERKTKVTLQGMCIKRSIYFHNHHGF